MADNSEAPQADSELNTTSEQPQTQETPAERQTQDAAAEATNEQASRPKSEKAEPINIVVRDQSGAGLQFKVRKNTKFEKVMLAFCQKKHYQVNQVRFLFEGERIREDQTPQDVDMEEGDIIDCVIEQLGGDGGWAKYY